MAIRRIFLSEAQCSACAVSRCWARERLRGWTGPTCGQARTSPSPVRITPPQPIHKRRPSGRCSGEHTAASHRPQLAARATPENNPCCDCLQLVVLLAGPRAAACSLRPTSCSTTLWRSCWIECPSRPAGCCSWLTLLRPRSAARISTRCTGCTSKHAESHSLHFRSPSLA